MTEMNPMRRVFEDEDMRKILVTETLEDHANVFLPMCVVLQGSGEGTPLAKATACFLLGELKAAGAAEALLTCQTPDPVAKSAADVGTGEPLEMVADPKPTLVGIGQSVLDPILGAIRTTPYAWLRMRAAACLVEILRDQQLAEAILDVLIDQAEDDEAKASLEKVKSKVDVLLAD